MARHLILDRAAPADLVRDAGPSWSLHAQVMSSAEPSLSGLCGLPVATAQGDETALVDVNSQPASVLAADLPDLAATVPRTMRGSFRRSSTANSPRRPSSDA
jgi:hypothetical protein